MKIIFPFKSVKTVDINDIWKMISPKNDDLITRSKFDEVSDEVLLKMADTLNVPHLPKDEL